ncbi:ABC transporter substrate-binding protein [Yinghuangia sp. ASG 101]|uniref:ABC transporter substrate-binding protein n=1 Tax=Yinghuangia sp. ASG 101 TaxID=2896848 RepID=UPI001E2F6ED6|nr:ABC transporter substrate-binding protein [Yinghuangia sp. ASG 101]UGQ11562.1 ABC transporter substrate-binding protein [Yinghuangia sp. ASG 101]
MPVFSRPRPIGASDDRSRALSRRSFLGLGGAGAAALLVPSLTGCSSSDRARTDALRDGVPATARVAVIGDGRTGPTAVLQRGLNGMDPGAALGGTRFAWPSGFAASLNAMEAIKAGSVDVSFATATALIYAIGGGVPIVPLAAYPLPANEVDILVPEDSPIRGAADLKGKRVADQQGTTGTYSLVKYLETAGLRLSDVQHVNLKAADAEAAFANGSVDAWISWQPMIELGRRRHGARTLPGVRTYDYAFWVASASFAGDFPEAAARFVRQVADAQRWINTSTEAAVEAFAQSGGFGTAPLEREVYLDLAKAGRLSESPADRLAPIDDAAATGTQDLADNFKALGVYPEHVDAAGFLRDAKFAALRETVRGALAA